MLVVLVVVCILVALFFRCRPVLTAFAESQAVWNVTRTANTVVAEVLEEYAAVCRDMVAVTYTQDQRLAAVMPDTIAVNTVRTAITHRAMDEMAQYRSSLSVGIPLGTLLGADWLSGLGPLITFPMSCTATVLSEVTSTFEAVGMNQSLYTVLLHLDISLYLVTPGGRTSVGTQIAYPMVETVVLGEVPDNLTEVYGDDQSLLGRIFDYGTTE